LGEIRKGIEGVDDEVRRQSLIDWLETDLPTFLPDASSVSMAQWRTAGGA
jgi:hypothetical protein